MSGADENGVVIVASWDRDRRFYVSHCETRQKEQKWWCIELVLKFSK